MPTVCDSAADFSLQEFPNLRHFVYSSTVLRLSLLLPFIFLLLILELGHVLIKRRVQKSSYRLGKVTVTSIRHPMRVVLPALPAKR